jgi:hypothetical protein
MVEFNLWFESAILASIFAVLIIIPCVLVALLGRKLIDQLGHHPSKSSKLQMSILIPLVLIEILTFASFYLFAHFFTSPLPD